MSGFFFGPVEKNSRTRKLKPQENNSKLKQKTQGFGKVWKNNYNYLTQTKGKIHSNGCNPYIKTLVAQKILRFRQSLKK